MRRHALSLYLDTSVLGGYFDAEFLADTRALWRLRETGRFHFFISQVVMAETLSAPAGVRTLLESNFANEDIINFDVEMEALAATYLAQKIVPLDCREDAEHVAVCVVARLDYLVSWNFKHLANARREAGFNAVNILQGYPSVRIVAPTFLIHGDQEEDL